MVNSPHGYGKAPFLPWIHQLGPKPFSSPDTLVWTQAFSLLRVQAYNAPFSHIIREREQPTKAHHDTIHRIMRLSLCQ